MGVVRVGFWQRAATAAVAVTTSVVVGGVAFAAPGPAAVVAVDRASGSAVPSAVPSTGPDAAPAAFAPSAASATPHVALPIVRDVPVRTAPPAQRVTDGVLLVPASAPRERDRKHARRARSHAASTDGPTTPAAPSEGFSFTLASFNVLGSQHTARGGDKPGYASGAVRARWAAAMMDDRGYDVAGLQEAQPDQLRVLLSSGTWKSFPAAGSPQPASAQSVIWRDDTWELVSGRSFSIPFLDRTRPQPVVLLRHRATGREMWFVNAHLTPRGDRRDGEGERNAGTRILAEQIRTLRATGLPIVLTGDMNEHGEIYCNLTSSTALVAASGGSNAGRCLPPRTMRVDWIFGTPELGWSTFRFAMDPQVRRVTDHTIPVVEVTVPPL